MKSDTQNKNRIINKKNIIYLITIIAIYLVIAGLVEFDLLNRKYKSLIVPMGANIMLAVSLNLITGILGELSLGHAGFMAIGAFSGALFSLNANLPRIPELLIAIVIGGTMAGIFGFLIGVPVLRLRGDYLAIVTLGFGEIVRSVITAINFPVGFDEAGERVMMKGTMGLSGMQEHTSYTIMYIATILTIVIIVNLINSRFGRAISSIRDNSIASESIGINTSKLKVMTFVIAAIFAGIAGVLYAHNFTIIRPNNFDYNKSIDILVFVVLGGMGNIKGSIIAAILLTLLPEALRVASQYRMLVYAILLIVIMIFNNSALKEKLQSKFSKKIKA